MLLTIVMPARNEAENLRNTVPAVTRTLADSGIPYQLLLVDDGSTDATPDVIRSFAARDRGIESVTNAGRHGFGMAVRAGLACARGEAIAIVMADGSDRPEDLITSYRLLLQGHDCVFGSRFVAGSEVTNYPYHKLVLNRLGNLFIRILFGLGYNDITNAFKCYHREVVEAMQPLISPHFNLTVEMPLKAIVRGFSFVVIPIGWRGREIGVSSLRIREMGSRYLFIVLYLWLEKYLARGDYHRSTLRPTARRM